MAGLCNINLSVKWLFADSFMQKWDLLSLRLHMISRKKTSSVWYRHVTRFYSKELQNFTTKFHFSFEHHKRMQEYKIKIYFLPIVTHIWISFCWHGKKNWKRTVSLKATYATLIRNISCFLLSISYLMKAGIFILYQAFSKPKNMKRLCHRRNKFYVRIKKLEKSLLLVYIFPEKEI